MPYNIVITEAAEIDFENSIIWYTTKNLESSNKFISNTKKAIDFAANSPFACSITSKKARHVLVHGFPYHVIFLVKNNNIVIIAILHHKRSPNIWKKRVTNH